MTNGFSIDSGALIFATLADVYLSSGMVDEAISILQDGLLRNPTYTLAKIILGRAFYMKGDIKEALKTLEGAYEEAKDSENLNLYLGHCYRKRGDIDRATQYYEATLKIDPQNSDAQREFEVLKAAKSKEPVREETAAGVMEERIMEPSTIALPPKIALRAEVDIEPKLAKTIKAAARTTFGSLDEPIARLLSIKHVRGAFISSKDGLLVHSYYQDRADIEELCALIADIYNDASESFKILKKEDNLERCIIEKDDETVCVINAGDTLFTVVTEPETKPGLVFVYARSIIDEIRVVLA